MVGSSTPHPHTYPQRLRSCEGSYIDFVSYSYIGFKSYLAMIEVDVHHNHPIIKGFVRILKDEVADSKARRAAEEAEKNGPDPEKGKHIFLW